MQLRGLLIILCSITLAGCISMSEAIERLNALRMELLPTVRQEITEANFKLGAPSFIRIFKEEAELEVWMHDYKTRKFQLYKTYPICSFSGSLGPKLYEGDFQAPEGFYNVSEEWLWPGSQYHLAMNIGFPNKYDKAHGRTGTLIMIHGGCESEGCYAMTDPVIEKIYLLVEQSLKNGQDAVPIHIFPFRMTNANMAKHSYSRWRDFWENLKQGYDAFERNQIPPNVRVQNGRYIFKTPIYVSKSDL